MSLERDRIEILAPLETTAFSVWLANTHAKYSTANETHELSSLNVIIIVPACSLAPLGARASADTVMTKLISS